MQHSLQNNQYPKTFSEASNILSNHKHDPEYGEKMKKLKKDKKRNQQSNDSGCYACGKPGHRSDTHNCATSKKPKKEWWINKAHQHLEKRAETTSNASNTSDNNNSDDNEDKQSQASTLSRPAWMGMHLAQLFEKSLSNMKDWILLDSQSSTSIFSN